MGFECITLKDIKIRSNLILYDYNVGGMIKAKKKKKKKKTEMIYILKL